MFSLLATSAILPIQVGLFVRISLRAAFFFFEFLMARSRFGTLRPFIRPVTKVMDAWMEKGPEVRSESETTRDGVCLAPYANRAPRSTSIYKLDRKVRRVRLELHGRASRRRAPARYIPSPSMGARRLLPSRSKGDRDF